MPLSNQQKLEIKKIIKDAIIKKINEYKLVGDVKPFHEKLFSQKRIRETSFFHSCSTTIGVTLFQNIAYLIAKGNRDFKRVEKQFEVTGNFSNQAKSTIEDIIFDLGRKQNDPDKRTPDIKEEIKQVLAVTHNGQQSSQISDLFIIDSENNEIYIEIKTAKPNKGESEKIKRTLLKIAALKRKLVIIFCGIAYNPYEPRKFAWPLPLNYLKLGEDLIVGKKFWNFLGGNGTYEDLLNVFKEIGKELKDKIEVKIEEIISIGKNKQQNL